MDFFENVRITKIFTPEKVLCGVWKKNELYKKITFLLKNSCCKSCLSCFTKKNLLIFKRFWQKLIAHTMYIHNKWVKSLNGKTSQLQSDNVHIYYTCTISIMYGIASRQWIYLSTHSSTRETLGTTTSQINYKSQGSQPQLLQGH